MAPDEELERIDVALIGKGRQPAARCEGAHLARREHG
jgi:hypothetical protein